MEQGQPEDAGQAEGQDPIQVGCGLDSIIPELQVSESMQTFLCLLLVGLQDIAG